MSRRNLGKMRHRFLIKTVTRVQDEGGGYARADTNGAEVWGRIRTVGALEANTYAQLQERVTHKAVIRWRSDLNQGSTIVWKRPASQGGNLSLYVITAHDDDPDHHPGEFLALMLREGGNL